MDHRTPIKLKGHCSDPVPMALLKGPIKYMDRKAPFDEYVNDGKSQGMACKWMQEILEKVRF